MIRYVMANIQMPIEVGPSGSITPLSEFIKIKITTCTELPKKDPTLNNRSIMEQINEAIIDIEQNENRESDSDFDSSEEDYDNDNDNDNDNDKNNNTTNNTIKNKTSESSDNKLMVFSDEIKNIKTQKPRINMSFKNKASKKHSKLHNFTMKSRPNSNKVDDDLSLPIMAQEQEREDDQSHSNSEQGSNLA